jgi:nucleoside-diphosphate-sugar epimerase
MNVLILGGTGFIGPHVARRLAEQGHEVTVFSRGKRRPPFPGGIRLMAGDYKRIGDYREEFRRFGPDVVLDMIPITEQDALNVTGAFRGVARRMVAVSSQDVYLAWGCVRGVDSGLTDPQIHEDSPLRQSRYMYRGVPLPAYSQWDLENYDKILVERVFQNCPDLPATIVRLPMVYGPEDPGHRVFPWLKRMDDGRPAIPLERGAARWRGPQGYVEDVAAALALAVSSDVAAGRVYNVAEPDVRPTSDFIREIGAAVGWTGRIVELPKGLLPGPWDPYRMEQHVIVDSSRIRRELGYREIVPRAEALRRTIEWERSHPPDSVPPEAFDYAAEDRAIERAGLQ